VKRLALLALVGCYDPVTPPPRASSLSESLVLPSDQDLALEIDDAVGRKRRADFERAIEAKEPGESLEHARLTQLALDRQTFTIEDLFLRGDDMFALSFRPEDGLGNGLADHAGVPAGPFARPNLRRVHQGNFGGPDAMSCGECHAVGGDDGAGTASQVSAFRGDGDSMRSADLRNPPAVLGLGPIERLATEMSEVLATQRAGALAMAAMTGANVTVALRAKSIDFGMLTARPDGSVDAAQVAGVDPDLVVKPFGWKGHQPTLREMIKESFRQHLGIVSMVEQQRVRDGLLDPGELGDGVWFDIDDDGVTIELEDGMVSTMVAYLSQIEVPIIQPPTDQAMLDRFGRGGGVFATVGCASCHTPTLRLNDPVLVTRPEQTENTLSPSIAIDVARNGPGPKIKPIDVPSSAFDVNLFSDLKRHDLGAGLSAPFDQNGIAARSWLTRPLWGLADTGPYLHDGRAPTIDDAIRMHGGEAQPVTDRYVALPESDRVALRVYLGSLARVRRVVAP
jgi:mono/diheme cytochrome c family protein